MTMTEKELRRDVRSPSGVYFLYGEEDYMKNHYAAQIRDAVLSDAELAPFNHVRFYDDSYAIADVREAIYAPPVMAEKRLVELFFADLDRTLNDKSKTAFIDMLTEIYGEGSGTVGEGETTVLVIRAAADGFEAGTAKRPSAFLKKVEKVAKAVRVDFQTDALLYRWLERHFAEYGLTMLPEAAALMLSKCGRSMYRLSGELAKTAAYTAESGRREVTIEDVELTVTRTDADDAFRLANCILEGNVREALDALGVKMRRKEEPHFVLAQITRVFCDLAAAAHAQEDGLSCAEFAAKLKMHTYRAGMYWSAARGRSVEVIDRAVERCAAADRKLKTTPLGYAIIERLICGVGGGVG